MKKTLCIFGGILAITLAGHAYADGDCDAKYAGTPTSLSKAYAEFLANALSSIKSKKRSEVLAISEKKILLVRRYASGGVDSRGGNLWVDVNHRQIDKNLVIHVPPMKLPVYLGSGDDTVSQPAQEVDMVSEYSFPETDGTAVILDRKACGKDKKCDLLPFGPHFEDMITGLMQGTANRKSAFVFKDGLLISGMDLISPAAGEALYFTKTASGYKLAAVIDFE